VQNIKVGDKSIKPCLVPPLCRAQVVTGQFAITGPMYPMLAVLEEVSISSTCDNIEKLPDVTFTIAGSDFTMSHDDYIIYGQQYDEVQCTSAFTPECE